jgi:hypothetical protein
MTKYSLCVYRRGGVAKYDRGDNLWRVWSDAEDRAVGLPAEYHEWGNISHTTTAELKSYGEELIERLQAGELGQ